MTGTGVDLVGLAREINTAFSRTDELRIVAGQKLLEAKRRVDAGEAGAITWKEWLKHNIGRSERDCRKVMAIASAPDPDKVLAEERIKARERMARTRRRANVRPARNGPRLESEDDNNKVEPIDDALLRRDATRLVQSACGKLRATKDMDKAAKTARWLYVKFLSEVAGMKQRRHG